MLGREAGVRGSSRFTGRSNDNTIAKQRRLCPRTQPLAALPPRRRAPPAAARRWPRHHSPPIRPAPPTVRREAEKSSGMSLTAEGGGSEEWSRMNIRNRDRMKAWKQSPDFMVNKGKTAVGVPMREVDPGVPTMNVLYVD